MKWNLDESQVTLIPEKQTNSIFKFTGFVLWSMSAELHDGEDKSFFSYSPGLIFLLCSISSCLNWKTSE